MKLPKNFGPVKHGYSGYGFGFDTCSQFSWTNGELGKNVVIFGVDNSSSMYVDNRKRDIIVLGKGPTDGLDDTKITTEAINFMRSGRKVFHLIFWLNETRISVQHEELQFSMNRVIVNMD